MKKHQLWLKELMQEKIKGQSFSFTSDSLLNFRLSDSSILISHIQDQLKNDPIAKVNFDQYIESTSELSKTKLWLKLEDDSLMTLTLADIYNRFITSLRNKEEEDYFFNSYDISFLGPLGPFQPLSVLECINEELLERYILSQLVKNKLPHRSLRIRTHQNIPVTYGPGHKFKTELMLEQFSQNGLLLSSGDEFFINNMERGKHIKLFMDTSKLQGLVDGNLTMHSGHEEKLFYTREDSKAFNLEEDKIIKSLSYQSSFNNNFYIFCSFQSFTDGHIGDNFKSIIDQVNESFKKAA